MITHVLAAAFTLAAASPDDAKLAAGEVVTSLRKVPGSDVEEATAKAVIDAAPEKVWALVSACAGYKHNMPSIVESAELSRVPAKESDGPNAVEITKCKVVADLPFPLSDLTSVTRGVHTIEPGKLWRRQWTLIEGDYTRNEGSWTLVPWGDGTKTLATYRIHAEPKVPLPAPLMASVQQGKLPEVMKKLRETVKR